MITAIVIAQIDPEAVNEKIETALEEDDEFQNKIAEKKKEIQKLKDELKDIKENPRQKIDPKLKDRLKKEILALAKEAQKRQIENKQSKIILGEVVKVKSDLSKLMKKIVIISSPFLVACSDLTVLIFDRTVATHPDIVEYSINNTIIAEARANPNLHFIRFLVLAW